MLLLGAIAYFLYNVFVTRKQKQELEQKVKELRNEGYSVTQILETMKKKYSDMTLYRIKKLLIMILRSLTLLIIKR